MANNKVRVTATLTAQNAGTDWLQLRGQHNFFDISVSGIFVANVTLQRKRPGEADAAARDVETYTGNAEKLGEMMGHWDVRLFIKTGEFTSGSVIAEIGS
jgi:hypothetical protein